MEGRTWRDILEAVIADPQQKQRQADELNVNPIVLLRWSAGIYTPSSERLHQLCLALPGYTELPGLLAEEFGGSFNVAPSIWNEKRETGCFEAPGLFLASKDAILIRDLRIRGLKVEIAVRIGTHELVGYIVILHRSITPRTARLSPFQVVYAIKVVTGPDARSTGGADFYLLLSTA